MQTLEKFLECSFNFRINILPSSFVSFHGGERDREVDKKKNLFLNTKCQRSQQDLIEAVRFIPSFFVAFANLVLEIDQVDSTIIDELEKITGIMFLVYPRQFMFSKIKEETYNSFIMLLSALYLKGSALEAFLSRIGLRNLNPLRFQKKNINNNQCNSPFSPPLSLSLSLPISLIR